VPISAGLRVPPRPFAVGTGDFDHFTWDSAFWTFNAVSNFAYGRYADMIVDVRRAQGELEGAFAARQPDLDLAALALWKTSPEQARAFLTDASARASEQVLARWQRLFGELLVKYLDGNVRDAQGKVTHPPAPEAWQRRVVQETGARLEMPAAEAPPPVPASTAVKPPAASAPPARP
jgi:hypothetical protein